MTIQSLTVLRGEGSCRRSDRAFEPSASGRAFLRRFESGLSLGDNIPLSHRSYANVCVVNNLFDDGSKSLPGAFLRAVNHKCEQTTEAAPMPMLQNGSIHELSTELPTGLSDQIILQAVLPANGPKLLARLIGTPLTTAKRFYYQNLSGKRRREVALALIAEMDRQDRRRAVIRQQLERMVGDDAALGGINHRGLLRSASPSVSGLGR